MMNCELRQLNTFIKSCSTSNAAIKNTASPIPKEGWYPAYSASGQDVWLPEYRYSGKGIVVSAVGARCGKCFQADGKWNVTANTHVLLVDESIADYKYCWYLLNNENWWIKSGSGQPFVKVKDSLNRSILLPDLSTQQNIATILDKISEGIALCRKMLGELDLMVKAKFGEMFGDAHNNSAFPYKNIGDLTTVTSGGTPDRENNLYWDDGNIRWVKTTELQNCTICDTEEKITKLGLENSSAKLVPAGSVLIAMYGQGKTRGMTAYLENESATNQACACILPSSKINQKYLWKYLMLSYDKLRSMAKGGNQPNLNIGIIKNFPVLYPPIELQNQYVEFVIYIDKSILTIKGILAKMEEMKLALMQKCFKEGKHGE